MAYDGIGGLFTAWGQLLSLLNSDIPNAVQRVANIVIAPAPVSFTPPTADHSGTLVVGPVSITWAGGVPVSAVSLVDGQPPIEIPLVFWATLQGAFPPDLWAPFTYIAFLESRFRLDAYNGEGPDDSYGPFQVNRKAWPEYSPEYLTTWAGNVAAAYTIFQRQGYGAWYNSAVALGLLGGGTITAPITTAPAPPTLPGQPPTMGNGDTTPISAAALRLLAALDAANAWPFDPSGNSLGLELISHGYIVPTDTTGHHYIRSG